MKRETSRDNPKPWWVRLGAFVKSYWVPVLAFVGVFLFAVRYASYQLFYESFGATPAEVGLGWNDALLQAIFATTLMVAVAGLVVGLIAPVYVGLRQSPLRAVHCDCWRGFRSRKETS